MGHPVRRFLGALLAWVALPLPAAAAEPEAGDATGPLAGCEALMAQRPVERSSVRCFREAATPELRETVVRRLEALRGEQPENPWLPYYLAAVEWPLRTARVPDLYEEAAAILNRRGDLAGEIDARRGRARFLDLVGRLQEAGEELERLAALAEQTEDPQLVARFHIEQAGQLLFHGGDLERALHLLMRDRQWVLESDGVADDVQLLWLDRAASVFHELGDYEQAEGYLERLLSVAHATGNAYAEAGAAYRLAMAGVAAALPDEAGRRKARERARRALDLARRSGNLSVEVQSHWLLGRLLAGPAAHGHLRSCLELTDGGIDEPGLRVFCLGALAEAEAVAPVPDLEAIERLLAEASATASAAGDPWSTIKARQTRSRVHWALGDREKGTEEGLAVLDRIEELRSSQAAEPGRAAVLATRWEPYQWLAGRLLAAEGAGPSRRDLELAFQVVERMRARTLLEALGSASGAKVPVEDDLAAELERVEQAREDLQRRLAAGTEDERRRLERELTRLEQSEGELRHRVAARRPRPVEPVEPLADLGSVEANLDDDQALLSFQYGSWRDVYGRPDTGSWVVVSTREGSRAYPLADRLEVEPLLEDLVGLDDPEAVPELMVLLYRQLLAEAIDRLPASVRHLVILADGGLHSLPFALLRPEPPVEASLAVSYRLSFAPSATLWLRWRRSPPAPAEAPALVLADPAAIREDGTETARGGFRSVPLAPLPHARREGRAVARRLGRGSLLRLGADASEAFLASHPLRRYALLHFAAHARAVSDHPGRSAVFLAPGSSDEDGWLQPGEIARLDLADRLVVLGACDTVAGRVVRGEGVMSLARAFFAAGARAVVGSHRPLPDREASRLFEIFYRRLADGHSVGHALAEAQRQRLRAGAPSAGWGGLVVLGDAGLVPFPGGLRRPWRPGASSVLAVLAVAGLALGVHWRRRERGTS